MDPETKKILDAMAALQAADQKAAAEAPAAETETPPAEASADETGAAASEEPAAEGAEAEEVVEQVTTKSGQPLAMTKVAIDELRRRERERGKRLAGEELAAQVKAMGYTSVDELMAAAARLKTKPAAKPVVAKPAAKVETPAEEAVAAAEAGEPMPADFTPQQQAIYKRKLDALEQERRLAKRAARTANEKLQVQERLVAEQKADFELKLAAIKEGVTDHEYAAHLYRKAAEASGKTLAQASFFAGLRKSHPYLFGVRKEPLTSTPKTPAPGPKANPPAAADPIPDARKMTRAEYVAHLQKMGLGDPSAGF